MNRLGATAKKLIIVVDEKTKAYGELLSALISMRDDKVDENGNTIDGGIIGVQDGSVETVVWDVKIYADNQAQLGSNNKVIFIGQTDSSKPVMSNINFENEFSQFGVFFGSLGNKAVIYADRKLLPNKTTYEGFLAAYSQLLVGAGTEYTSSQDVKAARVIEDIVAERREKLSGIMNRGIDSLNKGINAVRRIPAAFKKKEVSDSSLPANEEPIKSSEGGTEPQEEMLIPEANEPFVAAVDTALESLKGSIWPVEIVRQVSLGLAGAKSSKEILDQQYRCAIVAYYLTRLSKFME